MSLTSTKGAAAEHMAAAILSSMGYAVYFPMDPNAKADLLLERRGEYLKVQVKCAQWQRISRISERLTVNPRARMNTRYAHGDFDLLAALDGSRMWLIPYEDCRERTMLKLDQRGGAWQKHRDYDPSQWLVK